MLPIVMKNICTVFGLGNFTKMPGTLGSIAGVFLGFILLSFFPIQVVIVFFIFLLTLSLYAIKIYQKQVGKSDKAEIIIDEVLGQLLVIMFIDLEFLEILFAFILFRFFDILKIFPANIIDKKYSNHYGVIFDDIIAAIQALIVIFIFKSNYGKFF
jgi:phosphatidylglycerophosphatase A